MVTAGKFFLILVVFIAVNSFPLEAMAEKKIGIFLFSGETRYINAARGIRDKLKDAGFVEPGTKIIEENAGANKARAAELVKKFASAKMDLIFTMGTPATIALAREVRDLPIVFAIVYNPVEAGIAKDWKSSGNNTTGTSTKIPMSKLLDTLKAFKPVKRLAVLYAPGERQSEATLKDLKDVQQGYTIKIIPVPLTSKEDVARILPEVARTSDAIYITGSNLADSQVSTIVDIATKAKVVTLTHLEDLVEKGVLLGVSADSYMMGRLTGEKGVKILKGARPASIPIEAPKKYSIILNMKTAASGQFQIPQEFMKRVKKKIY